MVTKQHFGLKGLYKAMRQDLPKEQLIEDSVDAEIVHERDMSELKERNSAGARGKANKYSELKKIASAVYAELKTKSGRNPSFKIYSNTLNAHHRSSEWPTQKNSDDRIADKWSGETSRDWWKKLNKGEDI